MNRPLVGVRIVLATLAIALLAAGPLLADLIPPGGNGGRPFHGNGPPVRPPIAGGSAPMQVRVDPQATRSVLTIPQRLLPNTQLGFDEPAPAPGISVGRSAIAGLAMSIAVTGMFLVFRNRRSRVALMLIVCGAAILAAARLSADIAPPTPVPPPKTDGNRHGPLTFALRAAAEGKVIVKIVPEGDTITLVLAGNAPARHNPNAPAPEAPAAPTAPPAPTP